MKNKLKYGVDGIEPLSHKELALCAFVFGTCFALNIVLLLVLWGLFSE